MPEEKSIKDFGEKQGKAIPIQVWTGEGCQNFKTVGTLRWQICQPPSPAAFTPQDIHLVLISVTDWVNPRTILGPEILCHWENPTTPIGNWTCDLQIWRAEPQATVPSRAPLVKRTPKQYTVYENYLKVRGRMGKHGLDCCGSEQGQVAGTCEYRNGTSSPIKSGEFID